MLKSDDLPTRLWGDHVSHDFLGPTRAGLKGLNEPDGTTGGGETLLRAIGDAYDAYLAMRKRVPVCAEVVGAPELTHYERYHEWHRADEGFRGELAKARRRSSLAQLDTLAKGAEAAHGVNELPPPLVLWAP